MKSVKIFSVFILLTCACNGQSRADSLIGTYVGKYYYASPPSNPWTLTQDTLFVSLIDSVNCLVSATDNIAIGYGGSYYSDYYSCNGAPPSNYYVKFYSGDSVKWIDDNVPQQWPNPAVSKRFFGKRISGHIPTAIKKYKEKSDACIYPNPSKEGTKIVFVQSENIKSYEIIGMDGKVMRRENLNLFTMEIEITFSQLQEGMYFIRIEIAEGILTKKVSVQH